jgi:NAD dependent epimerase/dehydratase family enzyme
LPDTTGRVVVAGSSGLIGGALVAALRADGVAVTRLVRSAPEDPDDVFWDPQRAPLSPDVLAGARAVVGLNGASIGRFPWTKRYKHDLVWSRLAPTQALAAAVRALGSGPPSSPVRLSATTHRRRASG